MDLEKALTLLLSVWLYKRAVMRQDEVAGGGVAGAERGSAHLSTTHFLAVSERVRARARLSAKFAPDEGLGIDD